MTRIARARGTILLLGAALAALSACGGPNLGMPAAFQSADENTTPFTETNLPLLPVPAGNWRLLDTQTLRMLPATDNGTNSGQNLIVVANYGEWNDTVPGKPALQRLLTIRADASYKPGGWGPMVNGCMEPDAAATMHFQQGRGGKFLFPNMADCLKIAAIPKGPMIPAPSFFQHEEYRRYLAGLSGSATITYPATERTILAGLYHKANDRGLKVGSTDDEAMFTVQSEIAAGDRTLLYTVAFRPPNICGPKGDKACDWSFAGTEAPAVNYRNCVRQRSQVWHVFLRETLTAGALPRWKPALPWACADTAATGTNFTDNG